VSALVLMLMLSAGAEEPDARGEAVVLPSRSAAPSERGTPQVLGMLTSGLVVGALSLSGAAEGKARTLSTLPGRAEVVQSAAAANRLGYGAQAMAVAAGVSAGMTVVIALGSRRRLARSQASGSQNAEREPSPG